MNMNKIKETVRMKIAWALPKWIVYWASIRMIAHATSGDYDDTAVPELTAMDAIDRWFR